MSLGRLLSSGKSLVGLSSSRYQLRTGSLPKFESGKNPFARPATEPGDKEELSPAEAAAADLKKTQRLPVLPPKPSIPGEISQPAKPAEIRVNPPIRVPLPYEAKPAIPARALNENSQADQSPSTAGAASPSPVGRERASGKSEQSQPPAIVTHWLKKLNPLVWFGDRKPAEPKPAVHRFDKKPVQGELSLENIKVMRNDLSDADVEVVPKKALPMQDIPLPGASAAAMAIPELPPATNAWEYLGERLLRNH
jgi:hypothetical protein